MTEHFQSHACGFFPSKGSLYPLLCSFTQCPFPGCPGPGLGHQRSLVTSNSTRFTFSACQPRGGAQHTDVTATVAELEGLKNKQGPKPPNEMGSGMCFRRIKEDGGNSGQQWLIPEVGKWSKALGLAGNENMDRERGRGRGRRNLGSKYSFLTLVPLSKPFPQTHFALGAMPSVTPRLRQQSPIFRLSVGYFVLVLTLPGLLTFPVLWALTQDSTLRVGIKCGKAKIRTVSIDI